VFASGADLGAIFPKGGKALLLPDNLEQCELSQGLLNKLPEIETH
jgi:hypothetical protein